MATGKRYKKIIEGLDRNKTYSVEEAVKLVKAGTKTTRVLVPITGFKVIHNPSTHAVTLKLTSPQKFLSGGQLTVLASVATGSGSVLSGTTVFKIAAGGVKIGP